MTEYIDRAEVLSLVDKGYLVSNRNYDKVRGLIESIPAADVVKRDCFDRILAENDMLRSTLVPVRHGKWINQRADSEMCSACGTRFYISALFAVGGNDEPPYCPLCGARMDGAE